MIARPIVKWAGGKSKLLDDLLARVPAEMRTYAEPFAGGAALFFALASDPTRGFSRAVLCDRNEELVATYRAIKADPEEVIAILERDYRHDETLFYEVRERDTAGMTDAHRAARFIFLNKTCFNGLWRVNSKGKFNVPFGRYAKPKILDAEGLRAASRALSRAELRVGDFTEATRELGAGDFVYFDPPYDPVSDTSDFTAYAKDGFGRTDQRRLADEMRRLRAKKALVMLSNADTEAMRDLYFDFEVHEVKVARSINSAPHKRGAVSELLVTSWEPQKKTRRRRSR